MKIKRKIAYKQNVIVPFRSRYEDFDCSLLCAFVLILCWTDFYYLEFLFVASNTQKNAKRMKCQTRHSHGIVYACMHECLVRDIARYQTTQSKCFVCSTSYLSIHSNRHHTHFIRSSATEIAEECSINK